MKRLSFLVGIISVLAVMVAPTVVAADVNNFSISDYRIEMHLGIDSEKRSTLETSEIITAQFPNYDQNHGIERAIPQSYDGHNTNVSNITVTDADGAPRSYSTYTDDNGNLVVRMADMNVYVQGAQVYKLSYTQRDVTKYFADTASDEFYWDTNGTDWRVPIERLEARVLVKNDLAQKQNDKTACYQGLSGATDRCELTRSDDEFYVVATNLSAGENVTVAIGFAPQTFAPYQMTLGEKIAVWWMIWQIVSMMIGAAILVWLIVSYIRIVNRKREIGTIVPEYIPPSEASVTTSSQVLGQPKGSVMTAQLLDLAVRHFVKIYEVKQKKWFSAAEYEVEIVKDTSDLRPEEQELLSDSFGSTPSVGDRLNLKTLRNNTAYYRRTLDNDKKLRNLIRGDYGLRHEDAEAKQRFRRIALTIGIIGALSLSVPIVMMSIAIFIVSFTIWPFTDKGLALRRYLEGLKLYIGVAETERLKMLQSPEGAEKIVSLVSGTDQKSLVKLYERVLPYAILFGQEKEWSKQLGVYYEQTNAQPDWYTGQTVFNAAVFSSAMSGVSQAASYASSSSSSTGGSSGGGSSGGGGGGGGGGGV